MREPGEAGLATSREFEGKPTRRPERALRREGRLHAEATMHRGGAESLEWALAEWWAAGARRRGRKGNPETNTHHEDDEMPSHPSTTLYDGVYSPPMMLNRSERDHRERPGGGDI